MTPDEKRRFVESIKAKRPKDIEELVSVKEYKDYLYNYYISINVQLKDILCGTNKNSVVCRDDQKSYSPGNDYDYAMAA